MGDPNHVAALNWQSLHQGETKNAEQYLFNEDNLICYEVSALRSLNLVHKKLRHVDQPFSGILPSELAPEFAKVDLDTPLDSVDDALAEVEALYLDHAIYFHHPKYVAHLNCPVAYPAVVAEQMLSAVNSSMDTWDQSAGGTLIEQKLVDWTCQRIGLGENADGIFTSGGTQSNLMAMLMARDSYCQNNLDQHKIRDKGLPEQANRFRIFTSQVSHFSVQKSAAILGLGYDSVVSVSCDDQFKMDTGQLSQAIEDSLEQGLLPIAIVATAGTTDFGSIDPLTSIAQLCQQHKLWFHVDAAYGCGLLVSQHHRHLLNGIEQADSVTVDFHKSFLQPVSCGAFLLKDKQLFSHITHHAEYLNPFSSASDAQPNLVDKSIQTTRRFDALKLWLTLRSMGADNIGQVFEQVMYLAKQSYLLMKQDKQFELLNHPQLSTLVFRYVPAFMTNDTDIDEANAYIRKAIFRTGQAVVAGTRFNNLRYLKFTFLNPATRLEHIREILGLIKQFGQAFFNHKAKTASQKLQSHEEPAHV
jgi:L-2,4-diaminobutyrate decarboxylase